MATKIETLAAALPAALGDRLQTLTVALGEITAVVAATELPGAMRSLRDRPELRFETLVDLCGVDYSAYGGEPADFTAILDDIRRRDARDTTRSAAPLKPAPDAILLDTTALDADAAFRVALNHVEAARRGA